MNIRILPMLFLLALNGCSSSGKIMKMMKETPTFNWVYMPKPPKVGQTVTYGSLGGDQSWTSEVKEVKEGKYIAQMKWVTTPDAISFLKGVTFGHRVGKDGYVTQGWMVESDGKRTELRLAGSGDFGYVKNPQAMRLKVPEIVMTPMGSFKADEIVVYTSLQKKAGVTTELTAVTFYSKDFPYGHVYQTFISSVELPVSEVLDFIGQASSLNKVHGTLLNYLATKIQNGPISTGNHVLGVKLGQ